MLPNLSKKCAENIIVGKNFNPILNFNWFEKEFLSRRDTLFGDTKDLKIKAVINDIKEIP